MIFSTQCHKFIITLLSIFLFFFVLLYLPEHLLGVFPVLGGPEVPEVHQVAPDAEAGVVGVPVERVPSVNA